MLSASFYGRMARKQYIAGQFTSQFPFLEGVAGLGPFCLYMMAYLLCASQRLRQSAVVCGQRLPTLFVYVPLEDSTNYPFCGHGTLGTTSFPPPHPTSCTVSKPAGGHCVGAKKSCDT